MIWKAIAGLIAPFWPYVAGVAAIVLMASHGYAVWYGYSWAAGKCEAAALRSQIETLRKDADEARRSAALRAGQAEIQARENAELLEKVNSYEAELTAEREADRAQPSPPPVVRGDCRLNARDVERLRGIHP